MSGYLRWQRIIATLTMSCVAIAAMMVTQVHATAPNATQWQSAYATCSSVNVSSGQDITTTLRNDLGGGGCWQLPSGTFYLNGPVDIAPGNTLQGNGMGNTVLMARSWGGGGTPMLTTGGNCSGTTSCRTVANLTVNGNNGVAVDVLGATGTLVQSVKVTGGACSGIEINGSGADIESSVIQWNGNMGQASISANCPGASQTPNPGSEAGPGIYLAMSDADIKNNCYQATSRGLIGCAYYNVKINTSNISYNGSFGVDALAFSGNEYGSGTGDYVQFTNNTVAGSNFGGLALYASSHWNIQGNQITTPSWTSPVAHVGHIACDGTRANGSHSAAINICADDKQVCYTDKSTNPATTYCRGPFEANDNSLGSTNNPQSQTAANYYGIVLLGVLQGVTDSDWQGSYTAQSTHYPSGSTVGPYNTCSGSQVGLGYDPSQIGPSNTLHSC